MITLILCMIWSKCPDLSMFGIDMSPKAQIVTLEQQVNNIFTTIYKNSNILVSQPMLREDLLENFEDIDTNQDKTITSQEVITFYKKESPENISCIMFSLMGTLMDKNQDGGVSFAEWSEFGKEWSKSIPGANKDLQDLAKKTFDLEKFKDLDLDANFLLSMSELMSSSNTCYNFYSEKTNQEIFKIVPLSQ